MIVQHDVLSYMVPQGGFLYEKHLVSQEHPLYTIHQKGMVAYVKGEKGYPWDILVYNDSAIYQLITENIWGDPKTYKRFCTTRYYRGGIPHSPRFVYLDNPSLPVRITDTSYKVYTNCTGGNTQTLGEASSQLH